MGFNHAYAFASLEKVYGKSALEQYFSPFEGPVIGFPPNGVKAYFEGGPPPAQPPVDNAALLLKLRAKWLDVFLAYVDAFRPEISRDTATEWVNHFCPSTADELAVSLTLDGPRHLAARLVNAWDAS